MTRLSQAEFDKVSVLNLVVLESCYKEEKYQANKGDCCVGCAPTGSFPGSES